MTDDGGPIAIVHLSDFKAKVQLIREVNNKRKGN